MTLHVFLSFCDLIFTCNLCSFSLSCRITGAPSWPCGGRTVSRSLRTEGSAFRLRWSPQTSRRSSPWGTGCTSGWPVWPLTFRQCECVRRPLTNCRGGFYLTLRQYFFIKASRNANIIAT